MIAESVRRVLTSRSAKYHVVSHQPRFTAQEAAESAHVSGKHFAKAVLLRRAIPDGLSHYLLAVVPAHEEVNLDRLSNVLGEPVRLATESEAERLFPGVELGALPPLGELAGIPVVADACLRNAGWIVFHGGALDELVEMTWREYERLAMPIVVDMGRLPAARA